MSDDKSQFTVPQQYIDHDKQKLELELKEISFLLFQVYNFHNNGDRHFEAPVFPYKLMFLKAEKHPWYLLSCKVVPPNNKRTATFSFAASVDGQSFQNCSGLIDSAEITKLSLELWLKENPEFITLLRSKKASYKENFFIISNLE